MQNNEKPIVFLSHSSLDKEPMAALKKILDERAGGFVNFFLSSDGESITFGRNWVVKVSDALANAKLMFVFLSAQSADSKWIHFETGYACAKDIQVVPVCLPGIDLNRITPPISLLHGFNLHSHDAMGNIARICNKTLEGKMQESFTPKDFENLVSKMTGRGASFFGDYSWAIDEITISCTSDIPLENFNPIPALEEVCKKAGMPCRSKTGLKNQYMAHDNELLFSDFEQAGCEIKFEHKEDAEAQKARVQRNKEFKTTGAPQEKPIPKHYSLNCKLSPEMFNVNAPLLDEWFEKVKIAKPLFVQICLNKGIDAEKRRERLTGKLHQWGVSLLENGHFEFDGFEFEFGQYGVWKILFKLSEKLAEKRLSEIIRRMFESTVLWQHEPNLSELFA
jgi:hypothetical protein